MIEKLKEIVKSVKREVKVWKFILKDQRTPMVSKFLLALAILYALMPFDLIPDFIPGLGYLDDILLIGLLVFLALKFIPKEVVEDSRIRAKYEF
ncbi:MAG: DUF1232 domain-containing protein [Elusimicrobia bacterium]|nr:DUF1232 domain-containing protein [Elusimicrobiota bacterium]